MKIPMSKNYWNYCDSETTIADTIDIAIFLSRCIDSPMYCYIPSI